MMRTMPSTFFKYFISRLGRPRREDVACVAATPRRRWCRDLLEGRSRVTSRCARCRHGYRASSPGCCCARFAPNRRIEGVAARRTRSAAECFQAAMKVPSDRKFGCGWCCVADEQPSLRLHRQRGGESNSTEREPSSQVLMNCLPWNFRWRLCCRHARRYKDSPFGNEHADGALTRRGQRGEAGFRGEQPCRPVDLKTETWPYLPTPT